jgi:hypothetical protein
MPKSSHHFTRRQLQKNKRGWSWSSHSSSSKQTQTPNTTNSRPSGILKKSKYSKTKKHVRFSLTPESNKGIWKSVSSQK